jgi:enterobactin synthetase component D
VARSTPVTAGVDIALDLTLEHGRCIGLRIPAGPALADASLVDEERAYAAGLGEVRRRLWVAGRVALRAALVREGIAAGPLLADDRGAPTLPDGIAGSISHKESWAMALVAREARARLGVDVEEDRPRDRDVSSRVCTKEELAAMSTLDAHARGREVILRFSAKEAIYKAIDPFVRRYVGFHEVGLELGEDGSAAVRASLRPDEGLFAFDVRWRRLDPGDGPGLVLTTARVQRAS